MPYERPIFDRKEWHEKFLTVASRDVYNNYDKDRGKRKALFPSAWAYGMEGGLRQSSTPLDIPRRTPMDDFKRFCLGLTPAGVEG
jgi:hypothetical protein